MNQANNANKVALFDSTRNLPRKQIIMPTRQRKSDLAELLTSALREFRSKLDLRRDISPRECGADFYHSKNDSRSIRNKNAIPSTTSSSQKNSKGI